MFSPASAKAYVLGRLPFLARPIGKDAFYLGLEKVLGLVVGFLVSIVVIRHLGPQQYGLFAYVGAWVAVLSPLAMLGIATPIVKLLVQEPERAALVVSTALWLRFVAALVGMVFVVGLFASGLLITAETDRAGLVRLAAIVATQYIAQILDIFEGYNQANQAISNATRSRIYALVIVSPMRLLAAEIDCDVFAFAWLVVLQLLIGYAINYRSVIPRKLKESFTFDLAMAKALLGMGSFIIFASLLNLAQSRSELLILEKFAGIEAVGMYSVGLRFIELFDVFGTIAVTIYLPRLLGAAPEEMADDRALTTTYRLALLLFLAILPIIVAMAGIAWFTLDSRFHGIQWLILAMSTRPLFSFIGLTRAMYMLAANRLRYGTLCSAVGLCVSIAAGLIFIPRFGFYGAAISSFCSYLCSNLLIDAVFNRRYFVAFLRAFRKA